MTVHKFLPGSQTGDRESWRVFLSNYKPLLLRLCSLDLPFTPHEQMAFWHEVLRVLWANHYERLRGFPQQAERGFLVGLRAFLLDLPLSKLDLAKDSTAAPGPTVETLGGLLKGLPFFHQETIFRSQKNWGWGLGSRGLGTSFA